MYVFGGGGAGGGGGEGGPNKSEGVGFFFKRIKCGGTSIRDLRVEYYYSRE